MKRNEAGATPPLIPSPLHSRFTALPSRILDSLTYSPNQEIPQRHRVSSQYKTQLKDLAITSTERFRTNYDAILRATEAELTDVVFKVPEKKAYDPEKPIVIGIASDNQRKVDKMIDILTNHRAQIHRVPEAKEEHTLSTIGDATSKAISAAQIIRESEDDIRRQIRNGEHVTIANDQLNAVPVVKMNDKTGKREIVFERLGKPSNLRKADGTELTHDEQLESVRQTFKNMSDLATEFGWQRVPYLAEIATIIHNPNDPENNAISTQKTAMFLSPDGLKFVSSPDGFKAYLTKVKEMGLKTTGKEFDITKIAGGLELKVLQEMGVVQYITGSTQEIDIENTTFKEQSQERQLAAQNHAYGIALGHSDERLIAAYFGQKKEETETVPAEVAN